MNLFRSPGDLLSLVVVSSPCYVLKIGGTNSRFSDKKLGGKGSNNPRFDLYNS